MTIFFTRVLEANIKLEKFLIFKIRSFKMWNTDTVDTSENSRMSKTVKLFLFFPQKEQQTIQHIKNNPESPNTMCIYAHLIVVYSLTKTYNLHAR